MEAFNKKTIEGIDVKGKRVLVRCDFNVPVSDGVITDEGRIVGTLPTIKYLLDGGARVILCSHMGKPKSDSDIRLSLAPVAACLSWLLEQKVELACDVIGDSAKALVEGLRDGQAVLLENLRFHKGEKANDPDFAKTLASFADIYVNDAFGAVQNKDASIAGVPNYLPAYSGFLIEKEITILSGALNAPAKPFAVIMGGAKVSDKIGVINSLLDKVDTLIVGGGMAYSFFKAKGYSIGKSIGGKDEEVEMAKQVIQKVGEKGVKFILPSDDRVADKFDRNANMQVVPCTEIPDDWMGMDIGPATESEIAGAIADAGTIIWNGPMGVFEFPKFSGGTKAVAGVVAESDAVTIIGGGDSAAAVKQLGFADEMTHISTGGGAMLKFLEGKELPGISCLQDK